MTPYLSITEAAAEISVHPWTVWRLVRREALPAIRVGATPNTGAYRIPRKEWEAFKQHRTATRSSSPVLTPAPVDQSSVLLIDQVLGGVA